MIDWEVTEKEINDAEVRLLEARLARDEKCVALFRAAKRRGRIAVAVDDALDDAVRRCEIALRGLKAAYARQASLKA